jgi:hypothetical protein
MIEIPIHDTEDGRWFLSSPAGRKIVAGYVFDERRGYRVTLKFTDSDRWNSLSVHAARVVAKTLRAVKNRDARALGVEIARWADQCERLNSGWAQLGSPPGGFDNPRACGNA